MSGQALVYESKGEPANVLQILNLAVPAAGPADVVIKMLAAPINPSDINSIQGKYPLQNPDGVGGHEGVGRVEEVGSAVTGLQVGDWVVPLEAGQGTFRTRGTFKAADWHKVPDTLPLEAAATLCVNPPTALCMLEHFVDLKPGDVVVQNGATSAVGQAVIQVARAKGFRTINLIRPRPDPAEMSASVERLKGWGADVVTTEEDLKKDFASSGLPAPALGFNCVGGSSATAVAKALREGGTMVTYGAMGLQPVTVPNALFIFKDITLRGFWLSGRWAKEGGPDAKRKLINSVVQFYQQGVLTPPPAQLVNLLDWKLALEKLNTDYRGYKVLLQPPA